MKIKRRRSRAGIPFVPLADIIFNLILFFIILAKADDTSQLKWEAARTPAVLEDIPNARFSVTVDRDLNTYLNGDRVGVADIAQRLTVGLGTTPAGKRYVLLKVHKDTPASLFEPIIEAVSQAGGDLVHVLDQER